jgi:AcrR family transcriptional regulator
VEKILAPKRRGSETRDKILEVAETLIALHGVEGFQLKDVAAAIGIRPPSIFAHFAGREAIVQAVAERMIGGIASALEEIEGEAPDDTLSRWTRSLVAYLSKNPAHVRLILRDMARVGSPNVASYASTRQSMSRLKQHLYEVLDRGTTAGIFRPVRADGVIAQFMGAAVSNLSWAGWDEQGNPVSGAPIEVIQDEAERLILGYVKRGK